MPDPTTNVGRLRPKAAERWSPIPGLPGYEASTLGRILSPYGVVLALSSDQDGYQRVWIRGRTRKVHQLVLLAFVGEPRAAQEVLHRNHKRSDNRLSNLRYGSRSANARQRESRKRQRQGLSTPGGPGTAAT